MKNNDDLMQSFLDASKKFDYLPADLLDELMRHSLYEIAGKLYWHNSSTALLSLLGGAYEIELSNSAIMLDGYFKNEPYTKRESIFADFIVLQERHRAIQGSHKFSENTMNLIRKEILKRYEEWKPEIQKEFAEIAAKQAKEKEREKSSPTVIGWIVGIMSYLMLVVPVKEDIGATAFISILAATVIGVLTSVLIRNNVKGNLETKLIVSMKKKEEDALKNALLATGR
ncbi:MAG: hypothetical protein RDU59_04885 [Thermodesulfobacteriota bacterium]|nr:hypothetical protein [Thermodesulfobacteriota bacterium]